MCLCIQAKVKKNVETDLVGDKIGRIHLGKQDLRELQTRKMKGLKRGRDSDEDESRQRVEEEEDIISVDGDDSDGGVETKKQRLG